jgi:hypothetical protein
VVIEHRREHQFAKKPVKEGAKRPSPGCAVCGRAKTAMQHHGTSQSVNYYLSKDIQVYRAMKEAWEDTFRRLLALSGLEPCERVVAEGVMCFPRRRIPDQGNHRFLIEKALGDALVTGGYLPDDTWDRYEFGGLAFEYAKGEAWTRLMLFPSEEPLILLEDPVSAARPADPQIESLFAS